MKRREFTRAQMAAIVHRAMNADGQIVCEGCGLVLGSKKYEIDHRVAEALVVDKAVPLTIEDGQLLGMECCHRGGRRKTAHDQADIARAKRREARHLGIRKPSRWPKPPQGWKRNWATGRMEKTDG